MTFVGRAFAGPVNRRIDAAGKLVAEEAWRDLGAAGQPTFQNGWSNFGPFIYPNVAFRIDRDGVVHLRGGAGKGANTPGTKMFSLPPGYRPAMIEVFAVASTDGNGPLAPSGGIIEIQPNGDVGVYGDTDDNFVSLSGVSFTTKH